VAEDPLDDRASSISATTTNGRQRGHSSATRPKVRRITNFAAVGFTVRISGTSLVVG
jgi:hypothetical protein